MIWNRNGREALEIVCRDGRSDIVVKKLDMETGTEFVSEDTVRDCLQTWPRLMLATAGFDPEEYVM